MNFSPVGLGTWQLGSDCWGSVDGATAFKVLDAAVDSGVDFFDTADVYGAGLSEKRIGEFLKSRKLKLFVATKLGRFPDSGNEKNFSLEIFRKHTEASLKRLGRESLGLTQLHCIPSDILYRGEVFEWLRLLRAEGKIQNFGASVESMEEALFCLEQEGLVSLQIIFNIFRQKPIEVLFQKAKEKGVALIVRLPLASGLLSGSMQAERTFPANDHRNFNRDGAQFNVGETFAGIPFEKGVELAEGLKSLAPPEIPLYQIALRWILDFDAVSVIIPGCARAEQVRGNVAAESLTPLSPTLHEHIAEYYRERVAKHIRGPY